MPISPFFFFLSSFLRFHNYVHLNFELPLTKKHTYNSKNLTPKHQLAMSSTPLRPYTKPTYDVRRL
jgi:hypothetical protein